MKKKPVSATSVPAVKGKTVYPEPFATLVRGRTKRKLGDLFGLTNFGVNLTSLEPNAASALLHSHATQDEFVYVLEGTPTVRVGEQEFLLEPNDCIGFKAGTDVPHQVINRSKEPATFLEIGDRSPNDRVHYPNDDLKAELSPKGTWVFLRKDGIPISRE